jgi:hypothetical protein
MAFLDQMFNLTGRYITELLCNSFVGHPKPSKGKNLDAFIACELSFFRGCRYFCLFTFQSSESCGLAKFSASLAILTKLTLVTLYNYISSHAAMMCLCRTLAVARYCPLPAKATFCVTACRRCRTVRCCLISSALAVTRSTGTESLC